ncbi:MAG: hypothetical protein ACREYE_21775 [Gammaproteobacteria bacterium]
MSETIAITGKSVKLFKGHYTLSRKHPLDPLYHRDSLSLFHSVPLMTRVNCA